MTYKRLPYALRYLVALVIWVWVVATDLFLRFAFIYILPFVWLRTGTKYSPELVAFYTRKLMRPPRADWRRLFSWSSSDTAEAISLDKSSDRRV